MLLSMENGTAKRGVIKKYVKNISIENQRAVLKKSDHTYTAYSSNHHRRQQHVYAVYAHRMHVCIGVLNLALATHVCVTVYLH